MSNTQTPQKFHPNTVIFDMERKGFPYDVAARRHEVIPIGESMGADLKMTNTAYMTFKKKFFEVINRPKPPEVIVIEGFLTLTYYIHNFSLGTFKGFDVFTNYNKWIMDTLNTLKNPKSIIVVTGINELLSLEKGKDDGSTEEVSEDVIAIHTGKDRRGKIEPEFLVVLRTFVKEHKDKRNEHFLITEKSGINRAKSPVWMGLPKMIPNRLELVIEPLRKWKATQAEGTMMPLVMVYGPSGEGKSSSLESLPEGEVINVESTTVGGGK